MSKKYQQAKTWQQTQVLKAPVKKDEEEETVTIEYGPEPAIVSVNGSVVAGPSPLPTNGTWVPLNGSNPFTESRKIEELKKELAAKQEELRDAKWKADFFEARASEYKENFDYLIGLIKKGEDDE